MVSGPDRLSVRPGSKERIGRDEKAEFSSSSDEEQPVNPPQIPDTPTGPIIPIDVSKFRISLTREHTTYRRDGRTIKSKTVDTWQFNPEIKL